MKKYVAIACLAFFVGACSKTEEPTNPPAQNETIEIGDYDAVAAEASYQASCIRCHGDQLEGGSGPSLVANGFAPTEIEEILENGRGAMPPQSLADDERENLANWLADQ
ncbi:hypothetical protein J1TS1_27670 [Shouchella clausii]|uniref:Cytochrome c551 n=1 Tax=Shouchella clausii (strain KSM-K16) TaxID=66692 RepID=Q5WLI4_SHOC1|nr:cytochrome c [Shouchella clausii]KKI86314.1 cytochrome C551 [Shouchella clausii]BAD62771.1 cytochrome c551 [Shouchella clausii KSM-K16]GIN08622.1 hypothetical protein J1TS1_27670 [Shouchella clausii]